MTPRSRRSMHFAVLLLACACSSAAQSQKLEDLALGKILVTPRDAPDPRFAESVILLVRYEENGVVGLMVNRRTTVPISRALREIKGAAAHSDPMFVGGPVELDTVLAVARAPQKPAGAATVFGNTWLISSRTDLDAALGGAVKPGGLRVYAGYCGWTRRQLENEVRLGGWYVFDRSEDVAFDTDPETLWSRLIGKTELRLVRLGSGPTTR